MGDPLAWLNEALEQRKAQNLFRRLRDRDSAQRAHIVLDGRNLVNFGSNDYLGLACDERVCRAVVDAVEEFGWGAGASPLVTGHSRLHRELEAALAAFEQTEAALVFPSGFAANCGTLAALATQGDVIFNDRKNHASLWDGSRLSRADVRVYPHNDVASLRKLLDRYAARYRRRLIVTDTIFSMDGDLAPLPELVELADKFEAILVVDEAHATGVFGEKGTGVVEHFGLKERVPVRIGTLSKALGSQGGFVAGDRCLIEWLVNHARSYIYSTASPAAVAAASLAALEIVRTEPHRRCELLACARRLREALRDQGWRLGPSESQIVPVIVGLPDRAVKLSAALSEEGFFVPAIRPPTVPEGEACLRISVAWPHCEAEIDRLIEVMASLRRTFGD
ncbi:MAG: 8-amino-7-oxononanoate synthase [Planctomycetota bacterium]|nr:MAG: 8-amino-7-oxononanoate synthase [Planctomycetota bacterium]